MKYLIASYSIGDGFSATSLFLGLCLPPLSKPVTIQSDL
jgi:hypothetical protein